MKYDRIINVGTSILDCSEDIKKKNNGLIFEYALSHSKDEVASKKFYYDLAYIQNYDKKGCNINVAEIPYPQSFTEKINRVLLNIYRVYPEYSDVISKDKSSGSMLFSESKQEDDRNGLIDVLADIGYLNRDIHSYRISAKGWKKIEELTHTNNDIKQCFVAMAFRDETVKIYDSIKMACKECGYTSLRIDEKEHNNQIVPEIFFEIRRSKFVIMDVTIPNYGAYYEAGYALALGKEVIICCRKEEFDNEESRPHFDVQQKSTIVWDDEKDFIIKLKKRINATII